MALKSIFDSEIPMIGIDRSTKKSRFFSIADIRNLRSSKEYGAFTPFGGYSQIISKPTLITNIDNYTEFNFKVPFQSSPNEEKSVGIFSQLSPSADIVLNKEYVKSPGQWETNEFSIFENYGPFVCEAGSNAATIVATSISGIASKVNDYYNGWYIFLELSALSNLVVGAQVIDYVSSTKTFTLNSNSFTNIVAATDRFWLSRYNCIGNNGLTTGILNLISTDEIKFLNTDNGIIIYTNPSSKYPDKVNLLLSGIKRNYFENQASFHGLDLSYEQFPEPCLNSIADPTNIKGLIGVVTTSTVGSWAAFDVGTYSVAFTIEYDGFQESPLSRSVDTLVSSGNDYITINNICIPFESCYDTDRSVFVRAYESEYSASKGSGVSDINSATNPFLISKRATALKFYLKPPGSDSFLFARRISFHAEQIKDYADSYTWTYTDGIAKLSLGIDGDSWASNKITPYRESIRINYEHASFVEGSKFVANVFTEYDEYFPGLLMGSRINSSSIPEPDVFNANSIINLKKFLTGNITAISIFGKESSFDVSTRPLLMVFTEHDLYRLNIDVLNISNWKLSDTFYKDGLTSTKSVIFFNGRVFYFGSNKRYLMFDGNDSVEIGLGLKGYHKTLINDETDCLGVVYPEYNIIGFIHPSDQIGVFFDLNYTQDQKLSYISYNTPIIIDFSTDTILNVLHAEDGSYLIASDAIFKMNETLTQDSTEITASILLSNFKPSSNYVLPNELEIVSKTTNGLSLKLYIDDILKTTYSINGQTIEKSEKHKIDAKLRGQNIKFLIESLSGSSVFNFNDLLIDINSDNL